jgi:hypothetical protein
MKKFKFKVNHRKSGLLLKYITIEGRDIDDACEKLQDKLGISHSVRDSIRNPIVFYIRDPDGKYRSP